MLGAQGPTSASESYRVATLREAPGYIVGSRREHRWNIFHWESASLEELFHGQRPPRPAVHENDETLMQGDMGPGDRLERSLLLILS